MGSLILENKPKSPIAEAYRTIRTNIEYSSVDKEVKKILVTSAGPSEGKSTTAGNLALAFAQAGKKTLLIDCDMRKPTVYKIFKLSNRIGLSNVIVEGANIFDMNNITVEGLGLKDIIHTHSEKLDILTSGKVPPNPSEIIGSNKMSLFLEAMSSKYDRVIIDSPPINAVTDAQILSTLVDGVVLSVASEITHIDAAQRAKELLEKVGANILGVVLRRFKVPHSKYGYQGYYYYYSYGGESRKERKARKRQSGDEQK